MAIGMSGLVRCRGEQQWMLHEHRGSWLHGQPFREGAGCMGQRSSVGPGGVGDTETHARARWQLLWGTGALRERHAHLLAAGWRCMMGCTALGEVLSLGHMHGPPLPWQPSCCRDGGEQHGVLHEPGESCMGQPCMGGAGCMGQPWIDGTGCLSNWGGQLRPIVQAALGAWKPWQVAGAMGAG